MHDQGETTPATPDEPRPRRRALRIALACARWLAALFTCALAALLWWMERPYLLDLAAQFGVHAGGATLLVAIGLVATRRDMAALVAGFGAAAACVIALASHRPPLATPPPGTSIRIAVYNAHGMPLSADFVSWADGEGVDVLCVVESGPTLFGDPASPLPGLIHALPAGPSWRSTDSVFSRVPMQVIWPTDEQIRQRRSLATASRVLRLDLGNGVSTLLTTQHPPSPRTRESWRLSLERATDWGDQIRALSAERNLPVIVGGDMNSTPTGRVHRSFARASGLVGWTPLVGSGTWPSSMPRWASLPIDRIWASPGITVAAYEVGPRFDGSDHRPIVATVTLPQR